MLKRISTIFDIITTQMPVSALSSISESLDYLPCTVCIIACTMGTYLKYLVEAIQKNTHKITSCKKKAQVCCL